MRTGLTLYFHVGSGLAWNISYLWGKSTHFVYEDGDYMTEGTPLNKEWEVSIMFAWFYMSATFTKEL